MLVISTNSPLLSDDMVEIAFLQFPQSTLELCDNQPPRSLVPPGKPKTSAHYSHAVICGSQQHGTDPAEYLSGSCVSLFCSALLKLGN